MANRSASFGFLLPLEPVLLSYGATAETLVYDDPNTSMMKARQFGEAIADSMLTRLGLCSEGDRQVDRLRALTAAGACSMTCGAGVSGAGQPACSRAGPERRSGAGKQCDVHTVLRLPTGIFYAGGVSLGRRGRRASGSGDPALGGDELLPPEVIAQEIVEDLQAALAEFTAVAEALQAAESEPGGAQSVG